MSRGRVARVSAVLSAAVAVILLLAIAACAPAARAARAPAQDATSTPPVIVAPAAVPTPVAVPIDHSVVDPLLAQGYVWIKGTTIKLPPGMRLEAMLKIDCSRQARWCPSEVWTLSKGNSNIQVSVTDGIVVGETTDPSDPTAFAFLAPFVASAGALLDAWSPAERGRFKPPSFQSGPPLPAPTQDPSTVKTWNIFSEREIVLKGQRIPLPEGVFVWGGSPPKVDCEAGKPCPNMNAIVRLFKGPDRAPTALMWISVWNRQDPVVVAEKVDPADPTAFDFLKPYVRLGTREDKAAVGIVVMTVEQTATSTPP